MSANEKVKKSWIKQFIIPTVIFVLCMGVSFCFVQAGRKLSVTPDMTSFLAPGTKTIDLQEEGNYTVYLMLRGTYENKNYTAPEDLKGLTLEIKHGEEKIKVVKADLTYIFDQEGQSGKPYLNFAINEAGSYEFTATLENETTSEVVLAVGLKNEKMMNLFYYVIAATLIGLIGILEFGCFILYRIVKLIKSSMMAPKSRL